MVQDPVCLMNIDERKPAATAVYKGKTYCFCSAGCKDALDQDLIPPRATR